MLVTDRKRSRLPLTETVRLALEGGVDAVQLRERDLDARELYGLAEEMRRITDAAGAALLVNHQVDVALAVGADGVHLGWRSLRVKDVRKLVDKRLCIGISCHNLAQLHTAERAAADYVLLGPVFPTPSKQGLVEPIGLDMTGELITGSKLPVIAIGGIKPENAKDTRAIGAAGIAVISAIITAPDPREAARRLVQT